MGIFNVSLSLATAEVAWVRPADMSTTASPGYTRRPMKRTDTEVVRLRQRLQQKLKRDSKSGRTDGGQPRGLRG